MTLHGVLDVRCTRTQTPDTNRQHDRHGNEKKHESTNELRREGILTHRDVSKLPSGGEALIRATRPRPEKSLLGLQQAPSSADRTLSQIGPVRARHQFHDVGATRDRAERCTPSAFVTSGCCFAQHHNKGDYVSARVRVRSSGRQLAESRPCMCRLETEASPRRNGREPRSVNHRSRPNGSNPGAHRRRPLLRRDGTAAQQTRTAVNYRSLACG